MNRGIMKRKQRLRALGVAFLLAGTALPSLAQQPAYVLKGLVVDEEGKPVIGASVRTNIKHAAAITDENGCYEISIPSSSELKTVSFSYVGMKPVAIPADKLTGKVVLKSNTHLNEVVVTGIFRKSKESYTGAVSTISSDKLSLYKGQNVLQTLRSIDASLNIPLSNSLGSNPNAVPNLNIRGTSSLPTNISELNQSTEQSVNTPLIILDGFEISLTKLMDYNEEDIQSITILKDASATAIYGSRGANGVIVVETKKPQPGKLRITVSGGISLEVPDLTSYHLLNAADKLELERRVGLYTYNGQPTMTLEYQQQYYKRLKDVLSGVNTDWLSQPLRVGVGQNYNARLEGGREEFRWGVGLSYKDVSGAMKGSDRKVFNGDITLMYTWKNVLFRNYTTIGNTATAESKYGSFSNYVSQEPYNKPYDENGNIIRYFDGLYATSTKIQNPLYDATLNMFNTSNALNVINNFAIEWNITRGLTARGSLGISTTKQHSDIFYPAEHSIFNTSAYAGADNALRKGSYTYGTGDTFSYDARLTLSYTRTFLEKHQLYAAVDYSLSESKYTTYTFMAEGFSNQDLSSITNALQYQKGGAPSGYKQTDRRLGLTGNVNYTYDNRYYIDGSYRVDGSSQFGANKRYAPFWSVGLGWNIYREKFMEKLFPTISNLKLRGSYGETGTMDFSQSDVLTMYYYGSGERYLNWNSAHLQGFGNPDLTWQKTKEVNIGLELGLFNNLITGEFNYYTKTTDGLVSAQNIPLAMGFSSYSENIGKVKNTGYEASLSAYLIRDTHRQLTWMVSGQLVYNKNRILKLSDAIVTQNDTYVASSSLDDTSAAHLLYEDRPTYGLYVVRSLGIDPATGQELYLDRNGNVTNVWSKKDYVYAGVDATYGSPYRGIASTLVRWKNLTLNVAVAYQWGGQTYNKTLVQRVELSNNAIGWSNVDERVLNDRWQKPGDKTFFKGFSNESTKASSRFVMDDNWFEIQNIGLQYRWNTPRVQKLLGTQSILFSVNMNNLFHFSSIRYERGTDYPFARNIQGSITLIF